jgi:hypothetical protein
LAEDETQQSSTENTESPASTEGERPTEQAADEGSGESTPADIEAYWKKRQSNSDSAHAAATKVYEDRIAALEAKGTEGASSGDQSPANAEALNAANKRAEEAEARATAAELAAKYPNATKAVGRAAVVMDEAALASLNEQLDFDAKAPSITDPNNPARSLGSGPKAVEDMSLAELKEHFKTLPYDSGQ